MRLPAPELRLLSAHKAFVRAQLRRFGAPPAALEDLQQEVWLICLARSPQLDDERAARAWLTQVCRRVAAGERRDRSRSPVSTSPTAELPVDPAQIDHIEQEIDAQRYLEAMNSLSEEQLDVLSLYGSGELSMREVAELTGAPEGTVYSRYRAALDQVARELRRTRKFDVRSEPDSAPPDSLRQRAEDEEREAMADGGDLVVYSRAADALVGRIGNVILICWGKRVSEEACTQIALVVQRTYLRMKGRCIVINDCTPALALPNAEDRACIRQHIREHSSKTELVVATFDAPIARFIGAIVSGILLVTRSPISFAIVPRLEDGRARIEARARKEGPSGSERLDWERIAEATDYMRSQR